METGGRCQKKNESARNGIFRNNTNNNTNNRDNMSAAADVFFVLLGLALFVAILYLLAFVLGGLLYLSVKLLECLEKVCARPSAKIAKIVPRLLLATVEDDKSSSFNYVV